MSFEELNLTRPLLDSLKDLGYTQPTTIQEKGFSVIMSGKDVVGIAQTGTGKTFAYLLPCLRQWKFSKEKHPQLLILVPTRELVAQVVEEIQKLTTYMDEMLNLGFRAQLINVMDFLPAKRQNLLFSATITGEVESFIKEYFNDPVKIEAAPMGTPLNNIVQVGYRVPNFNTKVNLLELLLAKDAEMKKVLVFTSTKELADLLFEKVALIFPDKVGVIHSNKAQNHRFNSVRQFQSGTYRVLIATDLVARGLDISEVTHVLNFDVPEIPENYIHRIGRTGRADKKGEARTFITEKEEKKIATIEALMKFKIKIATLPKELEISTVLIEEEKPKVKMKLLEPKIPKKELGGGAFHEKKDKNKKTNQKIHRAEALKIKYSKPKSARGKKR